MSTHTFKTNIPGTSISSGIQWTLYISCNLESTGCQHQHQLIPGKLRFFISAKLLKGHFLAQIQVTQTHKLVETSYDQLSRYRHYWNDIEVGTCSLTPMLLCFLDREHGAFPLSGSRRTSSPWHLQHLSGLTTLTFQVVRWLQAMLNSTASVLKWTCLNLAISSISCLKSKLCRCLVRTLESTNDDLWMSKFYRS